MKYFNKLFAAALALLLCCACSDNDETPDPPVPDGPDYLFMFYGVGGSNLDESLFSNILQALDAGDDDNVKMTFQFKMSKEKQKPEHGFDGVRRFTGEDNKCMKGKFNSFSSFFPVIDSEKYDDIYAELKTERIGDADFDMSSSFSLTDFIKWSKDKYPTAKRTILVLAGHGRGWAMYEDATIDTRAMLPDDNNDKFMSLKTVVDGVKNAGNVDLIYDDACLMSMYETLYGYAECAKYFMGSFEKTPGIGADYINFINLLKEAGPSDAELEEALKKHCDHCVNEHWSNSNYLDIGFYNLTKLATLTPVLQNVVSTLVEKYGSEESIEPANEGALPLGDRFGGYIDNAFLKCEIVDAGMRLSMNVLSKALLDRIDVIMNEKDLFKWFCSLYQERDKEENEDLRNDMDMLQIAISYDSENSFSLTDLLRNLDNSLVEVGARNNPFGPLRSELLSELKKISYIRCITPDKHIGIDEEYELCSPGILIVPLKENLYSQSIYTKLLFQISSEEALKSYQSTAFDQKVGWSRMLTLLDVSPSCLYNPIRSDVK